MSGGGGPILAGSNGPGVQVLGRTDLGMTGQGLHYMHIAHLDIFLAYSVPSSSFIHVWYIYTHVAHRYLKKAQTYCKSRKFVVTYVYEIKFHEIFTV